MYIYICICLESDMEQSVVHLVTSISKIKKSRVMFFFCLLLFFFFKQTKNRVEKKIVKKNMQKSFLEFFSPS